MDREREPAGDRRRASYGSSVLVAVGWYATVVAAMMVGGAQTTEPHSCDNAPSWCFAPGQGVVLVLVLAGPALLGLLVVTLLIAAPISRRVPSAAAAGTLAAVGAVPLTGVVVAALVAAR